jgi:hypothetical protein
MGFVLRRNHWVPIVALAALTCAISMLDWAIRGGLPDELSPRSNVEPLETPLEILAHVQRADARRAILDELAEGRRTTLEALARFRALNLEWPVFNVLKLQDRSHESAELCLCRQLLTCAEAHLWERPDGLALAQRVEGELQAHLHAVEGRVEPGALRPRLSKLNLPPPGQLEPARSAAEAVPRQTESSSPAPEPERGR